MKTTTHPGDWIWIIADGRMVAMTHDAYDAARRIVELQQPDVYDQLRERQRGTGELYKLALDILVRDGELRIAHPDLVIAGAPRVPVYALPAEYQAALPQRPQRVKRRYRHKRPVSSGPPALVVVGGTAAE